MNPQQNLKILEERLAKCNPYGWPEDIKWLIVRIRQLEHVLNKITDPPEDIGLDAGYSLYCNLIANKALTTMPGEK